MNGERKSGDFPAAWVGRFGRERRHQADRRVGQGRRQETGMVLVERRMASDRRSLGDRRSATGQRRSPSVPMRSPRGL